ncbi:MAG: hypothetical protein KIS79_09955 [Burkholderiales bacterium]|nr:hypothetical protein [Burkholderiales bacterium]
MQRNRSIPKRERIAGRRSTLSFASLPLAYFTSPEYSRLSPRAVKLLLDLFTQFKGANNGDLCAAFSIMRPLGWTSRDQLHKGLQELLAEGWITVTRQGGKNLPTLFAVTWLPINECAGKLDVRATSTPLHTWKKPAKETALVLSLPTPTSPKTHSLTRHTGQVDPPHGTSTAHK